jgi:subtilisin family serine protease
MAAEKNVSKLHPKLRVIGNGSEAINYRRAELSSVVVSTVKAPAPLQPKVAGMLRKPGVLFAPGNEKALSVRRKPTKRAKLTDARKANQAYVNVFIEVHRGVPTTATGKKALKPLEADLRKMIAAHRKGAPEGVGVLSKRNFIAASVPVSELDKLERDPRIAFVQPSEGLVFRLPQAERKESRAPTRRAAGPASIDGSDVIIGIVDVGGFDFAHPDFADGRNGTRFIAIWDQGGKFRAPPQKYGFGAEFTKAHMNQAIAAARNGGLPATMLERQSQMTPGSHGTHVASIAAGASGVCPKARIAAVLIDIPPQRSELEERRSAFCDSSRIVQAVEYLLDIARREGKPISINISLGTNGGAHDGSAGVSRWLDAALATEGRAICIAAGNAGQEKGETPDDFGWVMGRIHGSGQIAAAGLAAELEWTVVGNTIVDVSENELEIWYSAQDRFSVHVRPPGATRWISVKP